MVFETNSAEGNLFPLPTGVKDAIPDGSIPSSTGGLANSSLIPNNDDTFSNDTIAEGGTGSDPELTFTDVPLSALSPEALAYLESWNRSMADMENLETEAEPRIFLVPVETAPSSTSSTTTTSSPSTMRSTTPRPAASVPFPRVRQNTLLSALTSTSPTKTNRSGPCIDFEREARTLALVSF